MVIGIAHQDLGNKGRQTGGQHHEIGIVAQRLFLYQAIYHNAHHSGPDVQNVNAPGTEADGQDGDQHRFMVGFVSGDAVEQRADQTQQTHIQEGRGITADGEGVGGGQRRIAEYAQ